MASLLDLAPPAREVAVRGGAVTVTGLGLDAIAALARRFAAMRELLGGGEVDLVPALAAGGGELIGAVIAAGSGHAGNPAHEAAAQRLAARDQLALLAAIVEETVPNGVGELVARVRAMAERLGEGAGSITSSAASPGASSPPGSA